MSSNAESSVQSSVLYKGFLSKRGRTRSYFTAIFQISNWQTRTVLLLEDKRLQYLDGANVKGEIPLTGCEIVDHTSSDCDGKKFPFEVRNMVEGKLESILFNAPTMLDKRQWIYYIKAVTDDTWLRDNNLDKLSRLLKLNDDLYMRIDETNKAALLNALPLQDGSGYENLFHDKFITALSVWISEYSSLPNFIDRLRDVLTSTNALTIRFDLVPSLAQSGSATNANTSGTTFFQTSFLPDGVLLVSFVKQLVVYNTDSLGRDLLTALSAYGRDLILNDLFTDAQLLGGKKFTLNEDNKVELTAELALSGISQTVRPFAYDEIFLDQFLTALKKTVNESAGFPNFIPNFVENFMRVFHKRSIVIRPVVGASTVKIVEEGGLLVLTFPSGAAVGDDSRFATLGADLTDIFSPPAPPVISFEALSLETALPVTPIEAVITQNAEEPVDGELSTVEV